MRTPRQNLYVSVIMSNNMEPYEKALQILKDGNDRFVRNMLEHPNMTAQRREEIAEKGQEPFAVVLTCSDSRVLVETIFDTGLGDIYIVRVAGNIASDTVIGSVEYAVESLHSPLLVILGHTMCYAVGAAVDNASAGGKVKGIVEKITAVVGKVKREQPKLPHDKLWVESIKANALHAKADLLAQSRGIRELVAKDKLKIAAAIYDIKTGKVEWIDKGGADENKSF